LLGGQLSRRYWEGEASGAAVLVTSYGAPNREAILPQFASLAQRAYSSNGIVFGAIAKRIKLFAEAEFKLQNIHDKSLTELPPRADKLRNPWPNGTTGELLARMEQDASLAGNAYVWDAGEQLVRLRPDWVTIVSEFVQDPMGRTYRQVVGYFFDPPVMEQLTWGPPQFFTVDEVAHWSPIPDPVASFRGMSWLTPVVREIEADSGMTGYKQQYLENAATPNLLIKYPAGMKLKQNTVDALRDRIKAQHGGAGNAFKTMILDQGADHAVVGNSFEQMNFTTVQAAGENRILIAAEVPGIVVGSKEGLMAATYSNYSQAMRSFADLWARPTWRSACACLAKLVPVPAGRRLWFDASGIAALRQGEKEQADTMLVLAQAAAELVDKGGYTRESVTTALSAGDLTLLVAEDRPAMDITTLVPKAAPEAVKLPALGDPVSAGAVNGAAVNGSGKG
jgi:phage portal protein BeeE